MKILSTSIAQCLFTVTPRPAYGPDDDPGAPLPDDATDRTDPSGAGNIDQLAPGEEDEMVDFSSLGIPKTTVETTPADSKVTQSTAEPKPKPEPEPEPKPDATSAKLGEPAPEKPPEKTEEKPPGETKLATDEELDAIKPHPHTPANIAKGITVLKEYAKTAINEAKAVRAERDKLVAEVEALKKAPIPEDVSKELETLRGERAKVLAEHDPKFIEEWNGKISSSDDRLIKYLAGHQLPQKFLDSIKAAPGGPANWQGLEGVDWKWIQAQLDGPDWWRATKYMQDTMDIRDQQETALEAIRNDSKGWLEQRTKSEEEAGKVFAGNYNTAITDLTNDPGHTWALKRDYPDNATPEQKKVVDDHNKHIDEISKKFEEASHSVYFRDPKAIAHHLFRSFKLDHMEEVVKAKDAELTTATKRVAELEEKLAKIGKAGKLRAAETTTKPVDLAPDDEMTAEEAVHAHFGGGR